MNSKPIVILAAGLTLLPPAVSAQPGAALADSKCTLSHGNETHSLSHLYVVRVPDPLYDEQQRLRILCLSEAVESAELSDAESLTWLLQRGALGFSAAVDVEGVVVHVEVSWGDSTKQFSGRVWGVLFEGAEVSGRLRGKLATTEPLRFDEKDAGWEFAAQVDVEIVEAE